MTSFDGTSSQRLWLCRWGTQSALVWAQNEENAELRVRHGMFARNASLDAVTRKPIVIRGDIAVVREATGDDKLAWVIAGGELPA